MLASHPGWRKPVLDGAVCLGLQERGVQMDGVRFQLVFPGEVAFRVSGREVHSWLASAEPDPADFG